MKQRLPAKRTTGWTSNLLAAAGDVLVPLLFAFGVGSIFSLICGCNPFTLYSYIIKKAFFSVGGLLNTLGYTTPIIITGMATALSIRANMYNMGIEGQVFLGAFTAALAGYMIKGVPTALHVTLCLLIGAAFGAVYALIPGLLKAKLRVNEVVTTVMLNSIATQVTGFLTQSYLGTGDAYAHTEFIEQTARLAKLNSKYRCTTAIFIALAIWLILYFMYCNHCLPCAKHINIAQLSKYLDMALLDGVTPTLQGHYDALEHHAGECIGCGRCETQCPFNVPIIQRMKQAAELFGK